MHRRAPAILNERGTAERFQCQHAHHATLRESRGEKPRVEPADSGEHEAERDDVDGGIEWNAVERSADTTRPEQRDAREGQPDCEPRHRTRRRSRYTKGRRMLNQSTTGRIFV